MVAGFVVAVGGVEVRADERAEGNSIASVKIHSLFEFRGGGVAGTRTKFEKRPGAFVSANGGTAVVDGRGRTNTVL